MDLSDRSLRDIEIYINKLNKYHTGFDITAASDIMVILCLSKNIDDFIEKINNIVIGYDFKNNPVYVRNFNLDRSIKILAANLIKPNCLLTKENNLCLMHGGPFANIAHGCNSIIALNESSLLTTFGEYMSELLRADILDILDCILHNDKIIRDANKIIDAILTKDFNKVVVALSQVIMELKDEINWCINPPERLFK